MGGDKGEGGRIRKPNFSDEFLTRDTSPEGIFLLEPINP
jgi:hypothetical protein